MNSMPFGEGCLDRFKTLGSLKLRQKMTHKQIEEETRGITIFFTLNSSSWPPTKTKLAMIPQPQKQFTLVA